MSEQTVVSVFAEGLLLESLGCVALGFSCVQGVPLIVMGITLTIVQLAIKKLKLYNSLCYLNLQKKVSGERFKEVRVCLACFSLLICEVSIVSSVIIAILAATLTACSLPILIAERRRKIKKVVLNSRIPVGIF
jgi:predicted cation transporter